MIRKYVQYKKFVGIGVPYTFELCSKASNAYLVAVENKCCAMVGNKCWAMADNKCISLVGNECQDIVVGQLILVGSIM